MSAAMSGAQFAVIASAAAASVVVIPVAARFCYQYFSGYLKNRRISKEESLSELGVTNLTFNSRAGIFNTEGSQIFTQGEQHEEALGAKPSDCDKELRVNWSFPELLQNTFPLSFRGTKLDAISESPVEPQIVLPSSMNDSAELHESGMRTRSQRSSIQEWRRPSRMFDRGGIGLNALGLNVSAPSSPRRASHQDGPTDIEWHRPSSLLFEKNNGGGGALLLESDPTMSGDYQSNSRPSILLERSDAAHLFVSPPTSPRNKLSEQDIRRPSALLEKYGSFKTFTSILETKQKYEQFVDSADDDYCAFKVAGSVEQPNNGMQRV